MSTFDPSGINVYPVGLLWRRVLDRPVRVQVIYGWLLPDLMALREGE